MNAGTIDTARANSIEATIGQRQTPNAKAKPAWESNVAKTDTPT
jgi:hypothetical protein